MTSPNPDNDRLMTVKDTAIFFSVKEYTVREWLNQDFLKGIKLNGKWRVARSEVVRYANELYGSTK